MAEYLIAISGDEQRWDAMTADEGAAIDEGHRRFREQAGTAVLAAGQLEGRRVWTTLRAAETGEPTAVDGPFAETKEMLGGFYLVDVPEKADAVALASLLAEARADHSGVEVIPLVVH
ncbi:YciI family protein [Humibacter antri]